MVPSHTSLTAFRTKGKVRLVELVYVKIRANVPVYSGSFRAKGKVRLEKLVYGKRRANVPVHSGSFRTKGKVRLEKLVYGKRRANMPVHSGSFRKKAKSDKKSWFTVKDVPMFPFIADGSVLLRAP